MVCELKIASGSKKMCKNFMVIRHCIKLRVISEKQCYAAMKYIVVIKT